MPKHDVHRRVRLLERNNAAAGGLKLKPRDEDAWVIDLVRREYYKYLYWSDTGQIGLALAIEKH